MINTMEYTVKILMKQFVTHDTKRFIIEKPDGYKYTPGQATEVAINIEGFKDKKHPFTFTSLNDDKVLEFTIKGYPVADYPNHEGVTEKLHQLSPGDELIIGDPWGTIQYKGTGVFIAGGAGITPFIAIFRDLYNKGELKGSSLLYSNKGKKDIIQEKELRHYFKDDLVLTLTREDAMGYEQGRIDKDFLKKHIKSFNQHFYVCGPKAMLKDIQEILSDLDVDLESIVFEE